MRIRMLLGVNGQAGSLGYKYQAEKQRILSTKVQAIKHVSPPLQVYAVAEYCWQNLRR
jgi:hypothetical protein